MHRITRRGFLTGAAASIGALQPGIKHCQGSVPGETVAATGGPRIGLVTYLLAKDWDVPTIIANCTEAKFEAVELRTTHAHGVEVTLNSSKRTEVRKMFEDSSVRLASLGSAFEYHSPDPGELKKNIEGTKKYLQLAADLGCDGIKVRPNRLCEDQGIKPEVTIAQIARSMDEVGIAGADLGVEIRVEVHGRDTSRIPVYHRIMESCRSSNVFACWNCNSFDLEDGGLEKNFSLLADKIHFIHMRDLFVEEYPWRKLFSLVNGIGYTGYCCAEIPGSTDPLRVMKYYRALFLAYQNRI
jgi:sugar phosphate isomerase/epimerase